jgi:hypothetical protein
MTQTANPNKALWEKGDFTRVAETMRASGEALVAVVVTARQLFRRPGSAQTLWASTSPATSWPPALAAPKPRA